MEPQLYDDSSKSLLDESYSVSPVEMERDGWSTVSYQKYGRPSKRSQRPNRNRYARLWASRLDTRRTYVHKPISMDTLATLRTNGGSGLKEYTGSSRQKRIVSNERSKQKRR